VQVKCDELERYVAEKEIARTMLQNKNGDLLGTLAATEGQDPPAIVELRAEDAVAVIFEADAGHKTKSSEEGPSRKRTRLS
jgi:hypothetical protein